MPTFTVTSGKLKKLNVIPLDKEKNLQKLLEDNLTEVLDMRFLATEYTTTFGGRIDTLAVDSDGAPVIIEYKRNRNDNVINQALSYLKWLKTQKPGFFEKLMMDTLGKEVADSIKLDWNNPRVVCIAESYSKFDIDTVEVVPLRIELMRYRFYENNVFVLDSVSLDEPALPAPVSSIPGNKTEDKNPSSMSAIVEKASAPIASLFAELRERILAIDESIVEKATAFYVGYRVSKNFAEVHIGKNQLKIHLRPVAFVDPKGLVEQTPEGYNWSLDRRVYLKTSDDLEYVVGLIEQSYKNVL